jgi:hypothetical protein
LSAEAVVDGEGAAATLWREQALLNAAIESREIERSVLLRMSPFTVKIRSLDDHIRKMATASGEKNPCRRIDALNSAAVPQFGARELFLLNRW